MRATTRIVILVALALAGLSAQAQESIRDEIYMRRSGSVYTLDVFKPKVSNHKAVVWIVGIAWYSSHDQIDDKLAKQFTDEGFTFFQVVHASQPNFTIPEMIPMVTRAVRFIRYNASKYDIDPNAIGVAGAGSGGQFALEIGGLGDDGQPTNRDLVDRVSSRANAVVALYPPTDLQNWGAKGLTPLDIPGLRGLVHAFGATPEIRKESIKEIAHDTSPINLVRRGYPATLLIHGTASEFVPIQQSKVMDAALERAKVEHKLILVPGADEDSVFVKGVPYALEWFRTQLTVSNKGLKALSDWRNWIGEGH